MNERGHLSEDILLDTVYGIADTESQAHAEACGECSARLANVHNRMRGANAAVAGEISDEFLAAQRRNIYARMERQPQAMSRRLWWWAPGLAAAAALVAGVFVYQQPHSASPVARVDVSDAQLFSDIYTLEHSSEPSAIAPARALFEDRFEDRTQ